MNTRVFALVVALALVFALAACSPAGDTPAADEGVPDDSAAGGTRLANGLYDLEGGTVQAIGVLEWVDLEGGFWAVTNGPAASPDDPTTIAVIANWDELERRLRPLEGQTVSVIGERFDGASIRMAGPEIVAESVEAIDDTGAPAE